MDRGILFTGPMVRAIQEDRKTQTRRVIKRITHEQIPGESELIDCVRDWDGGPSRLDMMTTGTECCPYGVPGDRLYIKETHYRYGKWVKNGKTKTGKQAWRFTAIEGCANRYNLWDYYFPDQRFAPIESCRPNSYRKAGWYKRSALFMPKEFARLWLEITAVRVERVHDIFLARDDIFAEGIIASDVCKHTRKMYGGCADCLGFGFRDLWDSINAKRGYGWDVNPWVWVVEFKKVED